MPGRRRLAFPAGSRSERSIKQGALGEAALRPRSFGPLSKRRLRPLACPVWPPRPTPDPCALVPSSDGELEQIQSLLGHVSIETTERYLGSCQPFPAGSELRIPGHWPTFYYLLLWAENHRSWSGTTNSRNPRERFIT